MLPPIRLPADLIAPVSAEATGQAALPATSGEFGAALAALFGRAAPAGPTLPGLPRAPADGQSLPRGGKALPPPEGGAAPAPQAEGIRRDGQPAIDLSLELTDTVDPRDAEMPLVPGTMPLRVVPVVGGDAEAPARPDAERRASLTLPATPVAEGVVLPPGKGAPLPPGGSNAILPEAAGLNLQPVVSSVQAAVPRHAPAASSADSLPSPVTVAALPASQAPPAAPYSSEAATAALAQAALSLPAELREPKSPAATAPAATAPSPVATLAAAPAPAPTAAGPAPAVPDLAQTPGSAGWGDALGERVVFIAGHKVQNAEIRLHPADLGPLRVQVSVDDGTATVHFHAHHPLTRDAIEQALPRLREMLVEQGLTPGHTSVSDHGASRHPQDPDGRQPGVTPGAPLPGAAAHASEDPLLPMTRPLMPAGLIDLFA
jgi:flagellar hook-length control protein FliK